MNLSDTQRKCLEWLGDDALEYGCPGGKRTLHSLRDRGLATINHNAGRWELTDAGRLELGPAALIGDRLIAL